MPNFDLEAMRSVDIRTVDPATLVDIQDVIIDADKPRLERILAYMNVIRNPYCFRCGDTIMKISYADTVTTMEERMEGYFRAL